MEAKVVREVAEHGVPYGAGVCEIFIEVLHNPNPPQPTQRYSFRLSRKLNQGFFASGSHRKLQTMTTDLIKFLIAETRSSDWFVLHLLTAIQVGRPGEALVKSQFDAVQDRLRREFDFKGSE